MIKMRLVRLLSHAKKYIVYNVLWQWAALLLQIGVIFTVTNLLGAAGKGSISEDILLKSAAVFAAALAGRFLCDKMAAKASYRASVDVKKILREKIYEKMLSLGVSYKENISTSEIVQMSGEGVEQLEIYFGKYLPQLFYSLLAPVTLFIILCQVSVKASLILLLCVPLIPLSIVAVQKIAGKLFRKYWGYYADLGDIFLENLQGLTTLKIYQADGMKAKQMDEASDKFRKITMRVLTMQLNSTSVMDIIAYGGAAVGMAVSAAACFAGEITAMEALTITLLASEFFIPLRLLGSFFHIAMNGMAASDKIFAFLDMEEPGDGELPFPDVSASSEGIEFRQVSFSYEKERDILKDITLSIPPGGMISLVGTSGCGKSTAAGLLTGKNKGYKGTIQIGGVNLPDIREQELMSHITLVKHNSYLFKGTVRDNLKMAAPEASDERLKETLCKVNLWEFLETREGLDTALAERGSNFSGGQCQRLALARALLHDTPVYIFDEASSNIDVESEEMIMDVIRRLAKEKMVLLISHRLSNVTSSRCIYMMENGRIVEKGTHGQLMEKQGAYYKLFTSQQELEKYGRKDEKQEKDTKGGGVHES